MSSHSIFNYANFLTFLRLKTEFLPKRALLILDEGHSVENQFVEQVGLSISKRILQDIFLQLSSRKSTTVMRT